MKCICCSNQITPGDYPNEMTEEDMIFKTTISGPEESPRYEKAENRMWNDGLVANVAAGYGSKKDGDMYVIAICDSCLTERMEDGTIAYTGDYMFQDQVYVSGEVEKYKKIFRRRNNLDKLI